MHDGTYHHCTYQNYEEDPIALVTSNWLVGSVCFLPLDKLGGFPAIRCGPDSHVDDNILLAGVLVAGVLIAGVLVDVLVLVPKVRLANSPSKYLHL